MKTAPLPALILLASACLQAAPAPAPVASTAPTSWMQVEGTVVPIRSSTARNADILGFARKGQVLAVEKTTANWAKVRVNDSLGGWVPLVQLSPSGPPVEWNPNLVKIIFAILLGTAVLSFLYLGLALHLKRRSETMSRSRQALVDARRRLQNKIQLLFRAEPRIPSHLVMDEVDLLEFLRNVGYVANLEKDPGHFLASCKAFKPNLILAGADFREQVEGMVETDAMLINTPVVYMRCERTSKPPENRIRAYLDPHATDRELGEAIANCLKKSPGKIRYSVKPVALKGEIHAGTLVDLLHFLAVVKKSGQLQVVSGQSKGDVLLHRGDIIRAGIAGMLGAMATQEILNLSAGNFEFHEKIIDPPGTAGINTQKILLDWARDKDERNHHSRA